MYKNNMNKYLYIEICRFVAAIIILCHHSYILEDRQYFFGGWVFVEFFFIITGFYTAAHFDKHLENNNICLDSIEYVLKKANRIIPFAWVGIFLGFIYYLIENQGSNQIITGIISIPYNLLLLKGFSIASHSVNFNPPLWFVSYIVFVLPAIIVLMKKSSGVYKYVICWLVPLLFCSIEMEKVGKIAIWEGGILQLMRGTSALMLGTVIYYLAPYIRNKWVYTKSKLVVCKILSIILFVIIAGISVFSRGGMVEHSAEFLCITFITLLLTFVNTDSYINNRVYNKVATHLGMLSLPIYCIHYPVEQIVQYILPELSYGIKLSIVIIVSLLLAECLMKIIYSLKKQ